MNILSFEPLPAAALLAVGLLYAAAVRHLAHRGRLWPRKRAICFFTGLGMIVIATQTIVAANDTRFFSNHVIQHLLLSMAGPIFLCLGAPITLFLQAANRKQQTLMLKLLHSRVARVVTHPVVAWLIFVLTLFVLYFSNLYEFSLENRWFHDFVHGHYVLAGFLFFSPVVAIDPHPWRMPHGARLLYVGLTLPAHAFLALALISATDPVALDWYLAASGNTFDQILYDQRLGAGIMWVSGDGIAIATVAVVASQWARQEDRAADREDRAVDLLLAEEAAAEEAQRASRTTDEAGLSGRNP